MMKLRRELIAYGVPKRLVHDLSDVRVLFAVCFLRAQHGVEV
jgi:hypothetical protein